MNQEITPQEQIQAYAVQALWLQAVLIGLVVAGGVITLLPKILAPAKEKK